MSGKHFRIIVAAVLCAVFCLSAGLLEAAAESATYTINEIDGMVITVPDGISGVTRSAKETDKYFSLFGLNYSTTMSNFKKSDIYFQAMDNRAKITLTVSMTETEDSLAIGNYNQLASDKLSEIQGEFLGNKGYISCTPDTAGSIVWLNFDVNIEGNGKTVKGYQANTVYDGKNVNIVLNRNSGDVTADDFAVFKSVVDSVDFTKTGPKNNILPYIIIGAALLAVLLVILLAVIIRNVKRGRKKYINDQIILELAGQYSGSKADNDTARSRSRSDKEEEKTLNPIAEILSAEITTREKKDYDKDFEDISSNENTDVPVEHSESSQVEIEDDEDFFNNYKPSEEKRPVKEYSDDEINAILAYDPDKGSFEEQAFAEVFPEEEVQKDEDESVTDKEETAEANVEETEEAAPQEATAKTEAEAETAEKAEENPDKEPEEDEDSEKADEDSQKQTTRKFTIESKGKSGNIADELKKAAVSDDGSTKTYSLDNFDENRSVGRSTHSAVVFRDSDDFFDEAPDRTMGIISGEDLIYAEDYDVIGEEEKRVSKVENGDNRENPALKALKTAGSGAKYFFVHCGYFVTNLSRYTKRKIRAKKRSKTQRRSAGAASAKTTERRQVNRSQNGELVQVRRRTDARNNTRR